ncbi:MAG TPA: DUF4041 domain-containing protein [Thermoanaerobaculia bacterium]|jgi:hypothetical protein|nr:DUF4041 domain-containing protein [Thermoanaerobaculia bacterium]
MSIVLAALGIAVVGLLVALALLVRKLRQVRAQYIGIASAEAEIARLKEETASAIARERNDAAAAVEHQKSEATKEVERLGKEVESLRQEGAALAATSKNRRDVLDADYANAKTTYDRLSAEVALLEENLEDISFSLYEPHFNFDTPDEYKVRMEAVREKQKAMLRNGEAAKFAIAWSVGGSRREGERMQKQYMKLLLRAFNGECDAAVARVSWNNITKMEERIRKSFEVVNDLGGVMHVSITPAYLDLKVDELRLEYELEEKKHQIAEEQRRIREQMREEEKAQREAEQAHQESQVEVTLAERAVEKARIELAKSQGEEHNRLNDRIVELQAQLEQARTKGQRAKALAELTKAGYVYVISNVGSFGEGVFKIGMTRRLDPMDRVKDLSSASVPFPFDVHAMVYSEDAPTLEWELQRHFADRSLNLVNKRKEFFRVSIEELDSVAREKGLKIYFTRLAEAREYRETLTMRAPQAPSQVSKPVVVFPDRLSPSTAIEGGSGIT